MSAPLLQVLGLDKSFASRVLREFSIEIAPGEVHALVGGNGAGKSTFCKIIAGLESSDAGKILWEGAPFAPKTRNEAREVGIHMVMQELHLIPTLSVAENLMLDALPSKFGVMDRKELERKAKEVLQQVHLNNLNPWTKVERLGIGYQQLLVIAAALMKQCKLLILDEPTAALTAQETETLFQQIRQLKAQGCAIIFISHRMEELQQIADRISILRDGQCVHTGPIAELSIPQMVSLMAGDWEAPTRSTNSRTQGACTLQVEHLCHPPMVEDVSFKAYAGEILGLSGLVGAGRTETLRAIFGADPKSSGKIEVGNPLKPYDSPSPSESLRRRIAFVSEDRKSEGLFLPQSIHFNTSVSSWTGLLYQQSKDVEATEKSSQRLALKRDSLHQSVESLSGGNQQKVVLSRWLQKDSEILLLDEPTRGIDLPAKETIYRLLRELAAEGKTVIVVSSELPELMQLCDRLVVLSAGKSVAEFTPDNWSTEALTQAAFKGHLTSHS